MTLETAKKLYDFYKETGQEERAEDIAKKRPEVVGETKQEKKKAKK